MLQYIYRSRLSILKYCFAIRELRDPEWLNYYIEVKI